MIYNKYYYLGTGLFFCLAGLDSRKVLAQPTMTPSLSPSLFGSGCRDTCTEFWCGCASTCFENEDLEQADDDCLASCDARYEPAYILENCTSLCGPVSEVESLFDFFVCDDYTPRPSFISDHPSESPSISMAPSILSSPPSMTPTKECTCCECVHTSGCNNGE